MANCKPRIIQHIPTLLETDDRPAFTKFPDQIQRLAKKRIRLSRHFLMDRSSGMRYGKNRGKWSDEEHQIFLDNYFHFPNRWNNMHQVMKVRSSSQIRSHAQKYYIRLRRKRCCQESGRGGMVLNKPIFNVYQFGEKEKFFYEKFISCKTRSEFQSKTREVKKKKCKVSYKKRTINSRKKQAEHIFKVEKFNRRQLQVIDCLCDMTKYNRYFIDHLQQGYCLEQQITFLEAWAFHLPDPFKYWLVNMHLQKMNSLVELYSKITSGDRYDNKQLIITCKFQRANATDDTRSFNIVQQT